VRRPPPTEEVIATSEQFDLVVIGGGPGGYSAVLYAASAGVKAAIVEMDALGGTCLNRGCIPAKTFLETAAVHRHVAHAGDFGIESSSPSVNFAVTQARKNKIVAGLVGGIAAMCKGRKVEVFNGVGSLGPDHRVTVTSPDGGTTEITGDSIILASGSVPRLIPNFERGGPIMTSDEVLDLDHVPPRLVVIGGGAIGCEFASTFADLGADVTILEGLPKILPGLDNDLANVVVRSFKNKRIDIKTGVTVTGHTPNDDGGTTVHFGEDEHLDVDAVVVSVGRRPFADLLGLDGTGVKVDERGFVVVDEYCRTGEDGVYAIGDLIDTPQLAHVGYAEAILVVKQTLGEQAMPVMYDRVPWAIYCHPEVAWAGPDEAQAKAAGYDVVVAKHPFKFNSRAQIIGETEGLAKIIAEKGPDGRAGRVLGVHMVGPWVTEQLSGGYLAVNWEATADEVAEFIQPHPSLSELFGETVMTLTGRNFNG
jgi:dihydrolipoamide dehydrogenase